MKKLIGLFYAVLVALLMLLGSGVGIAQTTTPPFSGVSGIIVTTKGTESLTPSEAAAYMYAVYVGKFQSGLSQADQDALVTGAAQTIATAHGVDPSTPFSITLDIAVQSTFVPTPPAWTTVAAEPDTITVKAGTTIRYGNVAGTVCTYTPACNGVPLAVDTWLTITLAQDTTFVVGQGPTATDPALGYKKVVQVLGSTANVTTPPTA